MNIITKARPATVTYDSDFYLNHDGIVYVKDKVNEIYRYDTILDTWEKMTVLSRISFPKLCMDLQAAKFIKCNFTDVFDEVETHMGL